MDELIRSFLRTTFMVIESVEQRSRIYSYQRPLVAHANESLMFFEEECAGPVSESLEGFFLKAGEAARDLFEKEVSYFQEAVEIMMGYAPNKRWWGKAMGMVLTVIESIKNLVSGLLDSNPLVKAGVEILEEAIKFVKE